MAPLAGRLSATGAFDVRSEPTEAAALAAIRRQEVFGALVPDGHPATLLVASPGSPLAAQLLTRVFTTGTQAQHSPLVVRDAVPLPPSDPRGVASAYLVLGPAHRRLCRRDDHRPADRHALAISTSPRLSVAAVMLAIALIPSQRQRAGAAATPARLAGEVAAETAPGAML